MLNEKYHIIPNPKIHSLKTSIVLRKAVVIGGSIAGLLAARVLSDHFEKVIILEKDNFTENDKVRKGTPQAGHIHLLLVRGKEILQEFFPELEDLIKIGVEKIDFLNDGRYLLPSGWAQRFPSGIITFGCTRILLEDIIRKQVTKISKIKIQENTNVKSLVLEKPNRVILETEDDKISGDLIVDCTGRNTKIPLWFEEIGYPKTETTRVDSFVGYATRRYILPEKDRDWKMFVILNKPISNPRAGIIFPIEGGKCLVGLYGIGKNYPPTEEKGFLEYARNLESNEIYNLLKEAVSDSDINGYKVQGSRRYSYEKMQ